MTDTAKDHSCHIGRPLAEFSAPYTGCDLTFAAQRLEGITVGRAQFKHCTFANMGFKEIVLENGQFLDCIFINCYFRRARFNNCRFTGSRFIDCNFPHVAINSCDFRYVSFRSCQIPFSEMMFSFPSEPNLREELTRNLALESSGRGLVQESRQYRMAEIEAHEDHLWAAIQGSSQWYRDHFDAIRRIRALGQWIMSLLNRWLWGYGEQAWVLVRNLLVIVFIICPTLFYLLRRQLRHDSGSDVTALDTIYFSIENIIPAGIKSNIIAITPITQFLSGIESLIGIVAIALFASYIFKWSLRR